MAKRPTRLRFTEDDLADSHVKKAADRADKAVDRAEKAADKLASKKAKPKLKLETDAAGSRKAKLRFEKAEFTEIERPSVAKHMASRGAAVTLTSKAHRAVSEYEDDNIGVQAVQETTKAVESTVYTVDHAVYSHKLKAYDKAEKLVEKSDKANVNALYEKFKKDNPDAGSNPFSRWQQKRAIKKEYAAAKAGKNTASTTASASKGAGKATGKAAQGAKNITERVTEFCTTHSKTILFVLIAGLLFMILSGMFSSCSAMFQGGTQIILGTSFTAKEEDIIGADNDYKALEAALRNKINNIERTHSGYDEYRYDLDEINHNPYELAAYLTVKFEDYTRDEVQATLQWLFEQQYELTLTEVVEIRTRTTSSTDPETGETTTEEEDYEYYILNVKLRNKGLNSVISNSGLSEDDMERYRILLQTRGNRPDIFGNDIYATPGGEYTDYDIPGEALTDTRFANMIREAEKYLGYPYVWGGSSPSTSFDCSGFVSYVINHCGNGWSVGRLTANGLMGAGKATGKAAQGAKNITERVTEFCTTHSKTILFVLIAGLLFMILSGMFSSCSAMFQGGTQIILGTSFTAKEEDIIGADNDYKALEAALRNKINNIERTHSGYDEYRYDLDEINHNPYELAAYLTVKFEDYTRDEVQATLQWLFEQQYELTLTEVVEIRTRTTSSTDPETGETTTEEEDYEYYILNVKLRNKGLNSVISNSGLSEDDMERYRILLQTRGNRPDIFGNDIYATPGGEYTDYDIPGEALTDTRFANMIREAEKYLGYPYVWGGSSPSTSFDCSGFVSYVINHCGNGWSVGRLTANGLMGVCDIIPKSSAKPGDLIFFQGTYDTSGASHVGIYVGNGMMIHCGNPISYASIESNYWQQHFYCFGRIRN